jgi:hypothetical protein
VNDAAVVLAADVARRWQSIDPLLPAPAEANQGHCGFPLRVTGSGGQLLAVGSCRHWEGETRSLDLTWGAARRFELSCLTAGQSAPAVGDALDRLLPLWRDHLRALGAGGEDTAAVITWPSRDVGGVVPLVRRGLVPLAVIAARITDQGSRAAPPDIDPARRAADAGVAVRRAGPADLGALVRLGLEVIRFDAHFGGVRERPSTAAALTAEFEQLLAPPQPWFWLAERDGQPVGMLAAEQPHQAAWIAPLTRSSPVAYLLLAGVTAGVRAAGVGAALAACLNAETLAAGVPATLLHYAQVNPLSAPFWGQQGYRPLWTCWEARPPDSVR